MFNYIDNSSIKGNDLKKIRVELGLTITALSRLANVSTKVISQTERMVINPTLVTKNKIVKGLNRDLTANEDNILFHMVFPNEDA